MDEVTVFASLAAYWPMEISAWFCFDPVEIYLPV
jgi:hypothetical protein